MRELVLKTEKGLLKGWALTSIGDIVSLINGRAFKPEDWSNKGLPIVRIQNLNDPDKSFNYCNFEVDKKLLSRWKLNALDAFMRDCGDATNYTATVSQYFTIPELIALKEFMYKKDLRRILQMAHEKFEKTNLQQWNHNAKWSEYCDVCKSKDELKLNMSLSH